MTKRQRKLESVRVVGGEFRSRSLQTPVGDHTRPTADRTRESLFHLLITRYLPTGFEGKDVVDLFAGSGALGIEALSRGAASLQSFDSSEAAINAMTQNFNALDVNDRARAKRYALTNTPPALEGAPHVVFCDPPYDVDATKLLQNLASQVREGTILCYEHSKDDRPVLSKPWRLRTRRTWGVATVSIFQCEF